MGNADDMSNLSMLELFRVEAENQTALLTSGLLALERAPARPDQLEELMRAAHSLKGAARIVNLPDIIHIAHAMEDCFVAAQAGTLQLRHAEMDLLFVSGQVTFEKRGRDGDIADRVKAVPIELESERHKVRVGRLLLVEFADRGFTEHELFPLGHKDRILVVKIGDRGGVFLVLRGEPLLVTVFNRGFDPGVLIVLRENWPAENEYHYG